MTEVRRGRRRRFHALLGSESSVVAEPTLEQQAEEDLRRTEDLLRPIQQVFRLIVKIVLDTVQETPVEYQGLYLEGQILPKVKKFYNFFDNVNTEGLEYILANSPNTGPGPSNFLLLNQSKDRLSGSDHVGLFLLDRSSVNLSRQERKRRKRCIHSMEAAVRDLPHLVVNAVAARIFEHDVVNGMKHKIIELDRFLNRVYNTGQFYTEERQMHLGYAIFEEGQRRGMQLQYFEDESLGKFAERFPKTATSTEQGEHKPATFKWSDRGVLISIFTIQIILSAVLNFLGWSRASNVPSDTGSAGFWAACNSGLMQTVGIVVFSISDLRKHVLPLAEKVWVWFLMTATVIAIWISVLLYILVSPKWSSIVAWFATVGQVIALSQLPLAWPEYSKKDLEKKSQ